MSLEQLLETVPEYAKDLRLNLSTLLRQTELTAQQLWGTALACAVASRNAALTAAIESEAAQTTAPEVLNAAKAAAAIMGMNNVYYRFLHLTDNPKYSSIPARLRMNVLRTHGVERKDFELWCLAVSAINNCPACVASHEKALREEGLNEETILASVRIAAVMQALATVLDAVPV